MDRGAEGGEATALSRDHVQIVPLLPVAAREAGPVIDVSAGFDRPRPTKLGHRAWYISRAWLWSALIALALVTALIAARGPIIEAAPRLAGVYAAIGLSAPQVSLELGRIQVIRVYSRGFATLRIEGEIINATGRLADLPPIELTLRSIDGGDLLSWQATAPQSQLGPGGTSWLATEINDPPPGAHHLSIRIGGAPEQIIAID